MAGFIFIKTLGPSSLEAWISPKKICVTELYDEGLSLHVVAGQYQLSIFATDEIIAQAIKHLESDKQVSEESAALYAKRLYNKALRSGIVLEETRIMMLFIEGLDLSVWNNMRVFLGQHSRTFLSELARHADKLRKIDNNERIRVTRQTKSQWNRHQAPAGWRFLLWRKTTIT